MNWKAWLYHLAQSSINGASAGLGTVLTGSILGSSDTLHPKVIVASAVSGAIVGTIRHLQQSPLPPLINDPK